MHAEAFVLGESTHPQPLPGVPGLLFRIFSFRDLKWLKAGGGDMAGEKGQPGGGRGEWILHMGDSLLRHAHGQPAFGDHAGKL